MLPRLCLSRRDFPDGHRLDYAIERELGAAPPPPGPRPIGMTMRVLGSVVSSLGGRDVWSDCVACSCRQIVGARTPNRGRRGVRSRVPVRGVHWAGSDRPPRCWRPRSSGREYVEHRDQPAERTLKLTNDSRNCALLRCALLIWLVRSLARALGDPAGSAVPSCVFGVRNLRGMAKGEQDARRGSVLDL